MLIFLIIILGIVIPILPWISGNWACASFGCQRDNADIKYLCSQRQVGTNHEASERYGQHARHQRADLQGAVQKAEAEGTHGKAKTRAGRQEQTEAARQPPQQQVARREGQGPDRGNKTKAKQFQQTRILCW